MGRSSLSCRALRRARLRGLLHRRRRRSGRGFGIRGELGRTWRRVPFGERALAVHTAPSSSAKADDPVTPGVNMSVGGYWMPRPRCAIAHKAEHDTGIARRRSDCDQAASAALAFSAIAWNAAGSVMARSDSTLRSTVIPDFDRPLIKTL